MKTKQPFLRVWLSIAANWLQFPQTSSEDRMDAESNQMNRIYCRV